MIRVRSTDPSLPNPSAEGSGPLRELSPFQTRPSSDTRFLSSPRISPSLRSPSSDPRAVTPSCQGMSQVSRVGNDGHIRLWYAMPYSYPLCGPNPILLCTHRPSPRVGLIPGRSRVIGPAFPSRASIPCQRACLPAVLPIVPDWHELSLWEEARSSEVTSISWPMMAERFASAGDLESEIHHIVWQPCPQAGIDCLPVIHCRIG